MLRNGRSKGTYGLSFLGCACHNSKDARRRAKHSARSREKSAFRRDLTTHAL
ncbi:MAG TPA: hypothetical protein VF867_13195 [Arthrobacter sp.]